MKEVGLSKLVNDPKASPVAIARALNAATSKEWGDWLPETLTEFCNLQDGWLKDRVMALQVVCTNEDLLDDWGLFCAVSAPLNGRRASFEWLDLPRVGEAALTATVIRDITGSFAPKPELLTFLKAMLHEEGLMCFPWADPWVVSLEPVPSEVAALQKMWPSLKEAEPSAVDEYSLIEAEAARLVRIQAYVRAMLAQ
jgi:hypothetical protein